MISNAAKKNETRARAGMIFTLCPAASMRSPVLLNFFNSDARVMPIGNLTVLNQKVKGIT
jgi:hypothetical protein